MSWHCRAARQRIERLDELVKEAARRRIERIDEVLKAKGSEGRDDFKGGQAFDY